MADIIPVIEVSSYIGVAPFKVRFDASKSSSTMSRIVAYRWSFGDGEVSTLTIVEHEFLLPGSYIVTLEVEDNNGITQSTTITINALEVQSFIRLFGPEYINLKYGETYNVPIYIESKQIIDTYGVQLVLEHDLRAFQGLTEDSFNFKNSFFNREKEIVFENIDVASTDTFTTTHYIDELLEVWIDGVNYIANVTSYRNRTVILNSIVVGLKRLQVKYKSSKINWALAELTSDDSNTQRVAVVITRPVKNVIEINGGAQVTNSKRVILNFNVENAINMQVWNSEDVYPYLTEPPEDIETVPYEPVLIWNLFTSETQAVDGEKIVCVRFQDVYGNWIGNIGGEPFTATILLDYTKESIHKESRYSIGTIPQTILEIEFEANTVLEDTFNPIKFIVSPSIIQRSKVVDVIGREKFVLNGDVINVFKKATMKLDNVIVTPAVDNAIVAYEISNLDTSTTIETSIKLVNAARENLSIFDVPIPATIYSNNQYNYTINTTRYPIIGSYLYVYAYDQVKIEYLPLSYVMILEGKIDKVNKTITVSLDKHLAQYFSDLNVTGFNVSHYIFVWRDLDYAQVTDVMRKKDENIDVAGIQVSRTLEPLTEDTFYYTNSILRDSTGYEISTNLMIYNGELVPWKELFYTNPDRSAPTVKPESKFALLNKTNIEIDVNYATITWETNEISTSEVIYFCNPKFVTKQVEVWIKDGSGNLQSEMLTVSIVDPEIMRRKFISTLSTLHKVTLDGLASGTKYYFMIKSTDKRGNSISEPNGVISTLPLTQVALEDLQSTIEGQKDLLYTELADVTRGKDPIFYEFVTKIDLTVKYMTGNIIEDFNDPGRYLLFIPLREMITGIEMGSYGVIERIGMGYRPMVTTEYMSKGISIDTSYIEHPQPITLEQTEYSQFTDNEIYNTIVDWQPQYIYLIDGYTIPKSTADGTFIDLDGDGIQDSWDNKAYITNNDSVIEMTANARKSGIIASVFDNDTELYDINYNNIKWTGSYREFIDYFNNVDVKQEELQLRFIPINNYPVDILERVFNETHSFNSSKLLTIQRWYLDSNTLVVKNLKSGRNYELDTNYKIVSSSSNKIVLESIDIPSGVLLLINYTYIYKSLVCNYLKDDQTVTSNGQFMFSTRTLAFNKSL